MRNIAPVLILVLVTILAYVLTEVATDSDRLALIVALVVLVLGAIACFHPLDRRGPKV